MRRHTLVISGGELKWVAVDKENKIKNSYNNNNKKTRSQKRWQGACKR